jgi:hypothetical protein
MIWRDLFGGTDFELHLSLTFTFRILVKQRQSQISSRYQLVYDITTYSDLTSPTIKPTPTPTTTPATDSTDNNHTIIIR